MQIKIEDLCEKKLLNLHLPQPIIPQNTALLFNGRADCSALFIRNLMEINGVSRCLLTDKILSVRYKENVDPADVKALVLAELDDFYHEPKPILNIATPAVSLELIEALADALIRPTLNRDKGDIKIHSFNQNNLELEFTGHCAGCPFAQNTLNNVIVKTLKNYIPSLDKVIMRG